MYQAQEQGVPISLIPTARAINEAMPLHMLALLEEALNEAGASLEGARILLMGYTYLENSDDTRNSPSAVLVAALRERGVDIVVHDPYIPEYQGDVIEMAHGCDGVVVMVAHNVYRELDIDALKAAMRTPVLVDGRRVFDRVAGWVFRGVGRKALSA